MIFKFFFVIYITCFSPDNDCNKLVIEAINQAESTIDIAAYSMTDYTINIAILNAKKNGIKIRILLDKQQAGSRYSIVKVLPDEFEYCIDIKSGLMHNKIIIIDNDFLLTGSYNFTANARDNNDENLIGIYDKKVVSQYKEYYEKLWLRHKCGESE